MNKPSLISKALGRARKGKVGRPLSLLWEQLLMRRLGKQLWLKTSGRGTLGPPPAKFHPPSFRSFSKPSSLAPCPSPIAYVFVSSCAPAASSAPRDRVFHSDSKGNHVPREAAVCKLLSTLYHGFPERLMLSVQLLPFYRGHNCSWELTGVSEISHMNYIFSSGIHLSIYISPFTLLSRTTLLKTYFKAHFKSCWLKSMPVWLSEQENFTKLDSCV